MTNRLSLLVADPDTTMAAEVVTAVSSRGADVVTCSDGAETLLRVGLLRPDVVLVATGLPVVGGAVVARTICQLHGATVIVGIGDGEADVVAEALAAGASACVARPYRLPELMPLLGGIRPNGRHDATDVLQIGTLTVDPQSYEVRHDGVPIHLTLREFEVLAFLMRHSDRVLSPEQITTGVWGEGTDPPNSNSLVVHIRRLRSKLGDDMARPQLIRNVRGLGYRFMPPEQ